MFFNVGEEKPEIYWYQASIVIISLEVSGFISKSWRFYIFLIKDSGSRCRSCIVNNICDHHIEVQSAMCCYAVQRIGMYLCSYSDEIILIGE